MDEIIGRIHSVETMGTVDGPGIRFIVFMQGCHLRCKYCHNRDTREVNAGENITVNKLVKKILRSKTYFEASRRWSYCFRRRTFITSKIC